MGESPLPVSKCSLSNNLSPTSLLSGSDYSLGMRQRLGLARALLGKPRLLILDEPTNGMDPRGIKDVRDLLLRLAEQHQTTVFISSHLLSEVQQLCTRVGILDRGVLVSESVVDDNLEDRYLSSTEGRTE